MCSTTHKSTLPSSASLNENVRNVEVVVLDDNGKVAGVEKGTTTIPPPKKRKVKVIVVKKKKKNKCCHCGKSPCEWTIFGRHVLSQASQINKGRSFGVAKHDNDKKRYHLYKNFTRIKFGTLGQYNRKQIPWCVEGRIKDLFPSEDGNYTYFQPSWL